MKDSLFRRPIVERINMCVSEVVYAKYSAWFTNKRMLDLATLDDNEKKIDID